MAQFDKTVMKLIGYSSDDLIPNMQNKRKQFIGGHCCYCGDNLNRENFSREHVVPKSRGGRNKKSNKLPCCISCNREKANMTLDEYKEWLSDNKPVNWSVKLFMCQQIVI